jgi:hypothetical protein
MKKNKKNNKNKNKKIIWYEKRKFKTNMVHNNPILQVEESNSSHNERRLLTKQ